MSKAFKLFLVGLTVASIVSCGGGKKETQKAAPATKAAEKVKVLEMKNQRISKQL